MRRLAAILLLSCTLPLLSACGGEPAPEVEDTGVPDAIAGMQAGKAQAAQGQQLGTPNKDRVVTLAVLNKRNNEATDLVMKPGESRRMGNLVVKVATCEKSLPWERPQEVGAFVQVFVEERATTDQKLAWHKVFSGWLFKNSPALNTVQHPIYDVWVKDCAMKYPGEEESPADAASSSSAAKASGSDSTPAPAPSSSPSAAVSPVAAASPEADPAATQD
ncbi:hypothetical protein GCM10011614_06670 [Novosphingobium colocasiae]|uniref:DUF2155 domain-containing protein n=1 Tax=Novosphingobium colocasiae TaxID=1256513 RepID=A0A918PBC4_9SPHN|nr:hypothetical protein GCM10011614_06670 [Novosphingobium colocasiae]